MGFVWEQKYLLEFFSSFDDFMSIWFKFISIICITLSKLIQSSK